jgi:PAS domain-containing protein
MLFTPSELARRALDAAPDAMVIIDQSGVVLFANRQVSALSHQNARGLSMECPTFLLELRRRAQFWRSTSCISRSQAS